MEDVEIKPFRWLDNLYTDIEDSEDIEFPFLTSHCLCIFEKDQSQYIVYIFGGITTEGILSKSLYQIKICGLNFSTKCIVNDTNSLRRKRQDKTFFQRTINETPEARERATFTRFQDKSLLLGGLSEQIEIYSWIFHPNDHNSVSWTKIDDLSTELSTRYSHTFI